MAELGLEAKVTSLAVHWNIHFRLKSADFTYLGGGGGQMIDDPTELDFVLNPTFACYACLKLPSLSARPIGI